MLGVFVSLVTANYNNLQILRLNNKLIEKDHIEFERGEFPNSASGGNFELLKEVEFYKKESKQLRNQVITADTFLVKHHINIALDFSQLSYLEEQSFVL